MPHEWEPIILAALAGIEPYEVLQALSSPRRLPKPGTSGGVRVVAVFARTGAGRPLMVLLRPRDGLTTRIVGVREMTAAELEMFTRWEAQQ
ncbi:hypothetical protein [Krasilnikovia sp. MM14-A1259]|uniref:hypothetical protein n=1 Tax=Krasilnikovia sp. MM14-A1259 TaxID=3373539 RepID=UPI0037FD4148